jgi:hypothetical protein
MSGTYNDQRNDSGGGSGGGLTVNSTTITGGADGQILWDKVGKIGESSSLLWSEAQQIFTVGDASGSTATVQIISKAGSNVPALVIARNNNGMNFTMRANGPSPGGTIAGITRNRTLELTDDLSFGQLDHIVIGGVDNTGSGGTNVATVHFVAGNVDRKQLLAAGGEKHLTGQSMPTTSIASGATYNVTVNDYLIVVTGSTAATTINLPASPFANQTIVVKDEGLGAGANNITVSGNGHNIVASASAATHVINVNGNSFTYMYDSVNSLWVVI